MIYSEIPPTNAKFCFHSGISTTSQPLVVANLVGIEDFGKAMAVVEIATVPASLAAGPFSGMWIIIMQIICKSCKQYIVLKGKMPHHIPTNTILCRC